MTILKKETKQNPSFDPGPLIHQWETYDYYPHQRGFLWYGVMIFMVLGSAYWSVMYTPWGWLPATAILLLAALYGWVHFRGEKTHQVRIYREGLSVDGKHFFVWNRFKGYWILYDEHSSVVHFQKNTKRDAKISIQLGSLSRDDIVKIMEQTTLPYLADQKESLTDLWIRALKL